MRFLIILLLISSSFADNYDYHDEKHINKELSHLVLSKRQNIEVKHILREFRDLLEEFEEFKESIEKRRKELFLQEYFDTKKLDMLDSQIDEKAHSIEKFFLKQIHAILTVKQREKFIHYFDDWEVE